MKTFENIMSFEEFSEQLNEKWKGNVEIEHTGEHEDKTVAEINAELAKLKKRNQKYKDAGKPVPKKNREKQSELNFAKRAKLGWNKVDDF